MILGGMGPQASRTAIMPQAFSPGLYALYSGPVPDPSRLSSSFAPALHRLLHRLHIDDKDEQDQS